MNLTGSGSSPAYMQAANIVPPPTPDTVSQLLAETVKAMGDCQSLVGVLYEHLGASQAPDKDATGGAICNGVAGLTMTLRSQALSLRSGLEEIANAL